MFLFHRSFWRLVAMSSAFGAAAYLARSWRQQSIPALPAPDDVTRPRRPKRPKRVADAASAEARTNGNGRAAH